MSLGESLNRSAVGESGGALVGFPVCDAHFLSISSTDHSNDKDGITLKSKKTRVEQDSSVSSVKITKEQLSAQDPSNIPDDWDRYPWKISSSCVAIWTAWLVFVQVLINKQTINGSTLHLVPPLLPWEAHPEMSLICLLMHYMPTKLITW